MKTDMYHGYSDLWKELIRTGLSEDGGPWDWTTLGLGTKADRNVTARVVAKSTGIWAAESLVKAIDGFGMNVRATSVVQDGARLKRSQEVVKIQGPAAEILALERPFLNLAAYISGIATQTNDLVKKVRKACPSHPPRVTLTRKTLPGYRNVGILGVIIGGGFPHRVGLSGGILIKENHIAAAGGISKAVEGVRKVSPHSLKIEIEVRSKEELEKAIEAQAEGVLLDNFTPQQARAALAIIKKAKTRPFVEISGGLNEENIAEFAIEGIDLLSVGSLTHSVTSVDLSLLIDD
jgi:nicotinate-nucleotide pyrophosphorylase (carboxylating)